MTISGSHDGQEWLSPPAVDEQSCASQKVAVEGAGAWSQTEFPGGTVKYPGRPASADPAAEGDAASAQHVGGSTAADDVSAVADPSGDGSPMRRQRSAGASRG